ncbi:AAA domain-containing protein [Paraflavisolibacter sp. H34]|uniref:DEAD/DEAH box helicase n=1 Tax=Huijunlia imazamoxiresistens TaxID=3127457 RepID=UPI0030175EA4
MSKANLFFEEAALLHASGAISLQEKYPRLRDLLEQACRELTRQEPVQFTNLFSRQAYLAQQHRLDRTVNHYLNGLRITANGVLHQGRTPDAALYPYHFKALCEALAVFFGCPLPAAVEKQLPPSYPPPAFGAAAVERIGQLRCLVISVGPEALRCRREEGDEIEVRVNVAGVNDYFRESVEQLAPGMELLLWQVELTSDGQYLPQFFIAEPDYLVDASALAECFKQQGDSPLHYLFNKFRPQESTAPLLLGNLANLFVDELMNEAPTPVTFEETLVKGFKQAAIDFTNNEQLKDRQKFADFCANAKKQFETIRRVIRQDFPRQGDLPIDPSGCILEPSFLSDTFGLQGRLDILEVKSCRQKANVVELKSGSPPFGNRRISENHERQLMAYELLLQSALDLKYGDIKTRLLYSKAEADNLRSETFSLKQKQELLNLRNLLVIMEYRMANDRTPRFDTVRRYIGSLNEAGLVTRRLHPNFLPYVQKDIQAFTAPLAAADDTEQAYFHAFVNFIARELYLSKCGDGGDAAATFGLASLWRVAFDEKKERCEILYGLTLDGDGNRCATEERSIRFRRTREDNRNANFRAGDVVILYPCRPEGYKPTQGQVFKCTIKDISREYVTLQLRSQQRNAAFFEAYDCWGVEKDVMDSSYTHMTRGLIEFLRAEPRKRRLLLGREAPRPYPSANGPLQGLSAEQAAIVRQALQSPDYFLIVGPPGTGKTSIVLKNIAQELLREGRNTLILAYTNRAVDEICEKIAQAGAELAGGQASTGAPCYLRIGSELSTDPQLRDALLDRQLQALVEARERAGERFKRDDIRTLFDRHKVVVGTLSSISGKPGIFDLKRFDTIIVDEASQILEPQLVGLLTRAPKFILIGDHKQLPAIVLQDEERARVAHEGLRAIGLETRSNSLFERLHTNACEKGWHWAHAALSCQGRMHEDLLQFPNHSFYESRLKLSEDPLRLAGQTAPLDLQPADSRSGLERYLCSRRLLFIPSACDPADGLRQAKTNSEEADTVVRLLEKIIGIYRASGKTFDPQTTLGVITPFRNQIAAIKDRMEESALVTSLPGYHHLLVDTVERYQGSQRDIILVSLCVSSHAQMDFLTSNTRMFRNEARGQYPVDRKLNVTLTRAREQLVLTGVEAVTGTNIHYQQLVAFIRSRGGYIAEGCRGVQSDGVVYSGEGRHAASFPVVEADESTGFGALPF